jgi:DNA-directed RNA polymerase subunit alpha
MRVGQATNFDRLILEVWTNGAVCPEDALVEGGLILRRYLSPFVMYHEMGEQTTQRRQPQLESKSAAESDQSGILSRPIAVLNLSVRSGNCLDAARVTTVGELVALRESELLRFRSFGKTSLHEVQRKLAEFGLSLRESDEGHTSGSSHTAVNDLSSDDETLGSPDPSDDLADSGANSGSNPSVGAESTQPGAFTMPD